MKTNKTKNTTQKTNKMHGPHQKTLGWTRVVCMFTFENQDKR